MADKIRIPEDLVQVNANALQQANQGLQTLTTNVNALNAAFDKIAGRNANSIKEFANEMTAINAQTQSFTKATAQNTEKIQENNQAITQSAKSYLEFKQTNEQITQIQAQNSKQVQVLTTRLNELTKQFNALDPTIDKDGKQLRVLSGEIRRTQKEIDLLNRSTANTRREFEAAEGSYNELVQANRRLTQQLKALPNAFSRTNKEAQQLQRQIASNTARLKEFDAAINQNFRNVGNYTSALGGATRGLTSFAAGLGVTVSGAFLLANGVRDAVGIIRDFQKENAILAGVLNTTRDETVELTEDAIRLGSTTARTATEVTGLQIAYARLGFTQDEILNLTEATISGSIALNSSLDETATLTGAVVRSFEDLSSSDAPRIIDALTTSTQISSLNFDALATALPKVAGAANALQVPLERVLADLAIAQDVTQDASIAGTSLRNIYIELAKAGITYEQALDKINNSQDQLTTAVDLFGKRAAVTALGLANNIDRTNELNESLLQAGGTAERVAEEQLDTLSGSLDLLASAWEGLVLSIDEGEGAITTSLRGLIDLFTDYFTALTNSEDATRQFAALLAGPVGTAIIDAGREAGIFTTEQQELGEQIRGTTILLEAARKEAAQSAEVTQEQAELINRLTREQAELLAKLPSIVRETDELNKEADDLNKNLNKLIPSAEELRKKFLDLFSITTRLGPELSDLNDELEDINQNARNVDFANAFIDEINKLQSERDTFDSLLRSIVVGDDPDEVVQEQKDALAEASRAAERFRQEQEARQLATFEITDSIGQAFFDNRSIRRQQELEEIEANFQEQITAAQGNAQQQAILERRLAQERRRIQQEQARADKQNAIFGIILNTARGITAALTSIPPNVPLSIAIGAIGAVQLGIAESTPIPQFATGTDSTPDGPIMINEAGKRELIITPEGKAMVYDTRNPVITDQIPKGSTIIPDDVGDLTWDYLNIKAKGDKKITEDLVKVYKEKETRIIEQQAQMIAGTMNPSEIGQAVARNLPPMQYWEMNNGELDLYMRKGNHKTKILNQSRKDRV